MVFFLLYLVRGDSCIKELYPKVLGSERGSSSAKGDFQHLAGGEFVHRVARVLGVFIDPVYFIGDFFGGVGESVFVDTEEQYSSFGFQVRGHYCSEVFGFEGVIAVVVEK